MRRTAPLAALALLAAAPPPVTGPGYAPREADERGLWMQVDEEERALKISNFLIRDPGLNDYVRKVFCRTVGEVCRDVRIYILRTPYFNASMAPNGMMLVWSGLFLRTRDEAQLAAVLGHEFTHYRERHSLQGFRDIKKKTNTMAWLSIIPVGGYVAAGAMTALQVGMIGSIFSFSREMESAADSGSIDLLAKAGYDPRAASRIWAQIRAEDLATAAQRGHKARREGGMFATHPTSEARQAAVERQAAALSGPSERALNAAEYRVALAPFWVDLIDDQIKLNDFGASELLLNQLAGANGWSGELLYARAELYRSRAGPGDFVLAGGYYRQAIAAGGAPVEVWRGLGLALLRAGDKPGGQAALATYLGRSPAAKDRPMMAMLAGVTP